MEGSVFHQRATKVIESAGLSWQQVNELYMRGRPQSEPGEIFNAILGDMWFRIPAIRIAEGHARHASASTYMYLFEWESPLIGAAHAMDLMVFGNGLPIPGMTALRGYEETAKLMRRAWISFATSGMPSTSSDLEWDSYGVQRSTMSLNEQPKLLADPYGGEIDLFGKVIQQTWDTLGL
jgi:carboxylesterase type B